MVAAGGELDLLVVTHIDQDHIGGVLALCDDEEVPDEIVKQFWFNSGELIAAYLDTPVDERREVTFQTIGESTRSLKQGITLETFLKQSGRWHDQPVMQGQSYEMGGAKIWVVAPSEEKLKELNEDWQVEVGTSTRGVSNDYDESLEELAQRREREDRSVPNGSSIAFLFEYQSRRVLLLGDAHSSDVIEGLARLGYDAAHRLEVDAVKLSHHGSKASNLSALWDVVSTRQYLISTDGSRYGLPNKEALARIILHPQRDKDQELVFYFNHDNEVLRSVLNEEECRTYRLRTEFPGEGQRGITLAF